MIRSLVRMVMWVVGFVVPDFLMLDLSYWARYTCTRIDIP